MATTPTAMMVAVIQKSDAEAAAVALTASTIAMQGVGTQEEDNKAAGVTGDDFAGVFREATDERSCALTRKAWKRVRVKCAKNMQGMNATGKAYAKRLSNEDTFQLRTIYEPHSCSKTHDVKLMSYRWLSKKMEKKLRDNPKMTLKDNIEKIKQKWTVNCSMSSK
ncbi:uncharacterized protein G2W53_018740 [Senna tora]|uniref:Uncharacterized protein n=1 Tax=Senna tora TaxID=362788 RepID=A0A834TVV1_9FABA|nr:uncharacterized protein G2W53_018740 [Senna tora]